MRKLSLLTATVLVSTGVLAQDATEVADPAAKLGWQMAIHAYTFRKFSIFECIDKTAALGLKYMSLSGNVSLDGTNMVPTLKLSDKDAQAIKDADGGQGSQAGEHRHRPTAAERSREPKGIRVRQEDGHRHAGGRARARGPRHRREALQGIQYQGGHSRPSTAFALLEPGHRRGGRQRPHAADGGLRRHRPLAPLRPRSGRVPQEA